MIKEVLCILVLIACLEYFGHSKLVKRKDGWSYFTGRGWFTIGPKTYEVSSIAQWASYVVGVSKEVLLKHLRGVSLPKNSRNYLILLSPKLQRKISKICASDH